MSPEANVEGFNWKTKLPHFLRQYWATPHSTTKISPLEACTGIKRIIGQIDTPRPIHDRNAGNNSKVKEIMKWYTDRNKKQPSQNTTAELGTSRRRHWPPHQCTQNGIYVL